MTQCQYLLCRAQAKGLVRIVDLLNGDQRQTREIPMCEADAEAVGKALARDADRPVVRAHITPGGAIYLGEFDDVIRDSRRR